MNSNVIRKKNQEEDTLKPTSEDTLEEKKGGKKTKPKFRGVDLDLPEAHELLTVRIEERTETGEKDVEGNAQIQQVLTIHFLDGEYKYGKMLNSANIMFTVQIKPRNRQNLYWKLAKFLSSKQELLFTKSEESYRWNDVCFEQFILLNRWLADITVLVGGGSIGTRNSKAAGTPFSALMDMIHSNAAFAEKTATGACTGIPFSDGELVYENGQWVMKSHAPENRNFWHLPVAGQRILDIVKEHAPTVPMDFTIENPEQYDLGDGTYEYEGVVYANLEDFKYHAEFKRKNPYLVGTKLERFLLTSLTVDQVAFMQQWFGYHLIKHMIPKKEKFLLMYGKGQDGKSMILRLIQALVGGDLGCLWLNADELNMRTKQKLQGKRALCSSETENLDLTLLKALVSGEEQYSELKFKDGEIFKPEAIISLACNQIMNLGDKSRAIARRLFFLHMKGVDDEDVIEDIDKQIIAEEMDVLVTFAMVGASIMMEHKGFYQIPASIVDGSREVAESADVMHIVAEEILEFHPNYCTAQDELYEGVKRQIEKMGNKPLNQKNTIKEIERLMETRGLPYTIPASGKRGYEPSYWERKGSNITAIIAQQQLSEDEIRVLRRKNMEPVSPDLADRPKVIHGVRIRDGVLGAPSGIGMKDVPMDGRKNNGKKEKPVLGPSMDDADKLAALREAEKKEAEVFVRKITEPEADDYQDVPF